MYILGIGTATPPRRYKQSECLEALAGSDLFSRLSGRSRAILRKVLNGSSGIGTRCLALDPLDEFIQFNPDALHARFLAHAPPLAATAAVRALADAQRPVEAVDALVVSTCTGYLCPGLSSYLIERLGLRKEVTALDLVGQGCGAALPNLQTGAALVAAGARGGTVLCICVEVCSAAFYLDDDPGLLISACIFGDGAAATVLSDEPRPGTRVVRWSGCRSMTDPGRRDLLRFEQRNGMLRNVLTPPVPDTAACFAREILGDTLRRQCLGRTDIRAWLWHTGGRDVLDALARRLELAEEDLRWSRGVLRDYGNMSSPSVLFVLERALRCGAPPGWWWLAAFGAGFSSHGALLHVEDTCR